MSAKDDLNDKANAKSKVTNVGQAENDSDLMFLKPMSADSLENDEKDKKSDKDKDDDSDAEVTIVLKGLQGEPLEKIRKRIKASGTDLSSYDSAASKGQHSDENQDSPSENASSKISPMSTEPKPK